MNKLVNKQSESPDVSFRAIDVMNEAFWTHIDWTANGNIFKRSVSPNSEPEVGNLVDSSVIDQNI